MKQATHISLTQRALAHIDAGTTDLGPEVIRNAVASYTDNNWLQREQDTLFRSYPLFMGLSCRIPEPGDYLSEDFAAVPILMIRGDDGQVRAFVNMCRHRGAPLAKNCGNKASFTCPYHAWRYNKQGKLQVIPDQDSFPGIDKDAHSLIPLPCAEQDGMLWVIPNPDATINLAEHLCGMDEDLANYNLVRYSHYEGRVLERRANWKMPIDTFLEAYHFATLHRDSVASIFHQNLCLFDDFGLNLREAVVRKSIKHLREQDQSEWDFVRHTAISYQLFPNTVFVMQGDHLETWRIFPLRNQPDQCIIYFDCYVPEPAVTAKARKYWDANVELAIRTVDTEDVAMQIDIERSYLSGVVDHVLIGRNEPALAHFQMSVERAVRGENPVQRETTK
ncbi:MAG: SRPBCC family protein [Porticoccaceae bacterium]